MGWNCMVALMKVRQKFGRNAAEIGNVIHGIAPAAAATSCNATMDVLNHMMCPGSGLQPNNLTSGPTFDPQKAVAAMRRLIGGDEPIFVSIKPDHHFSVLPLTDETVTLLQGFQGSYSLHEWITASGKIPIGTAQFLDDFDKLFSGSPMTAQDAAVALFGVPGKEGDIRAWFPNGGITAKNVCSAATNLFAAGSKAALGPA
jgi:hypothetical protein